MHTSFCGAVGYANVTFDTSMRPSIPVNLRPSTLNESIVGTRRIMARTLAEALRPRLKVCAGCEIMPKPSPIIMMAKMAMMILSPATKHGL